MGQLATRVSESQQRVLPLPLPLPLSQVVLGWDLGTHQHGVARTGTASSRSSGSTQRGDHRQPECEDYRSGRGTWLRGYDAGKRVKGRKRHILVDTLGNLLHVVVHSAALQDRAGAKLLLQTLPEVLYQRLERIWADGGYRGKLVKWVKKTFNVVLEIVLRLRSDAVTVPTAGFAVLPKRWIVERTLAWLGRYRRLSKDYEQLLENSEGMVLLASIHHLLKRLAPTH